MGEKAETVVSRPQNESDHSDVDVLSQVVMPYDGNQNVERILGTSVNFVTEGPSVIDSHGLTRHLLELLPDGIAILDENLQIVWANKTLIEWCDGRPVLGVDLYRALAVSLDEPDSSDLRAVTGPDQSITSILLLPGNRWVQLFACSLSVAEDQNRTVLVRLCDMTHQIKQQQKLDAIHQAGIELADLCPDELRHMSVQDRIELLKSRIIHYTKDLLHFETVEIRLLDHQTGRLEVLLAVGMTSEATERELFADGEGNGVTGYVAATGSSYVCADTMEDRLYLRGAQGARSSLTVALMLHDEVIGTFNVESTDPGAFSDESRKFLEIFSRDVALAINTLELLVAEKLTTTTTSIEAIHREIALPADEVLIDAAWVLERYIGHDQQVSQRLHHILDHTRQIKLLIQKVGQDLTSESHPSQLVERPRLQGKRVLVVDNDDSVRQAAHGLLERYGCIVESGHNGQEAVVMAQSGTYDLILADIRLPDMSGFECYEKIRGIIIDVPVILMTGFGYDPGHSIVKARRLGLNQVLYKPFRVDQLLDVVESVVV